MQANGLAPDEPAKRTVEVEADSLTLTKHAKNRACQRVAGEVVLTHVGIADDDAVTCAGVVRLDHTLHDGRTSTGGTGRATHRIRRPERGPNADGGGAIGCADRDDRRRGADRDR